MDTWKHHQTSAPRRDCASPHRRNSHGYPEWISRIPRIPPDARTDESNRFRYSAKRRPLPPFEPESYSQKPLQHRSRSPPYFAERQPYQR